MSAPATGRLVVALPGAVLAAAALTALAGPWLPLPPPAETDLGARLLPVGTPGHWLGTDPLGRDVLARLVSGLRVSLAVSAFGTAVAAALGTGLGLLAGQRGGRLDDVLMRGMDVLLAFPYVLLALCLVAVLGPGLRNAALAVAIVNVPFFARTVRGATLSLRRQEFVEVARLSGHSDLRILVRELLPNVAPVLGVAVATTLGWMLLETAGLSFLGLGAQPPQADLGSMLGTGRRFLATAPHLAIVPGVVLFVLSLSVHALADGLRDRMDPRRVRALAASNVPESRHDHAGAVPSASEDAVLVVSDLRIEIPGAGCVVDALGFEVGRGEAVALVGESGSGKTVTALSLLGLAPAPGARTAAGTIRLEGRDLTHADAHAWRALRGARVAYVPQDPGTALHPMRPIGAQVVEAVRAHGSRSRRAARERAVSLLGRVALREPEALLHARPHQLSGGMKQRVLLAMALAHDPALLVADEPTTALDVTVQAGILELLDRLRREGGAGLLLVTHDLGVVAELCQRVVVMRGGRRVEEGAVEEVLFRPKQAYTRELVAAVPRLDAPRALLGLGRRADREATS